MSEAVVLPNWDSLGHVKTVRIWPLLWIQKGLPGWLGYKEPACNRGNAGDAGSILGWRFPGGGNGDPLQYSCLEKPHGWRSLVGYSPRGPKEWESHSWNAWATRVNSKTYWTRLQKKKLMVHSLPSWRWCTHSQVSMYLSYLYWLLPFPCNKGLSWDCILIKVYYAWKRALGAVHSCVTQGRICCSVCDSSNLTEDSGSPGICKFIDAEQACLYDCLFFNWTRKGLTCWHQVNAPI